MCSPTFVRDDLAPSFSRWWRRWWRLWWLLRLCHILFCCDCCFCHYRCCCCVDWSEVTVIRPQTGFWCGWTGYVYPLLHWPLSLLSSPPPQLLLLLLWLADEAWLCITKNTLHNHVADSLLMLCSQFPKLGSSKHGLKLFEVKVEVKVKAPLSLQYQNIIV